MINILLNLSNFDEPWAYETMEEYLHPTSHVLILPLSYNESWLSDHEDWYDMYGRDGRYYDEILRPFRAFGIHDENVSWVNYYEDDQEEALHKIKRADVLVLTGGVTDWVLQRLDDLGIREAVCNFPGVVMGISAGAMIQLSEFHRTPDEMREFDYQSGLGLVEGFDIDVHYEQTEEHLFAIIRSLEDKGQPIVCSPNKGGIVIDHGEYRLLGNAFVLTPDDLDEVYKAYDESRSTGW